MQGYLDISSFSTDNVFYRTKTNKINDLMFLSRTRQFKSDFIAVRNRRRFRIVQHLSWI